MHKKETIETRIKPQNCKSLWDFIDNMHRLGYTGFLVDYGLHQCIPAGSQTKNGVNIFFRIDFNVSTAAEAKKAVKDVSSMKRKLSKHGLRLYLSLTPANLQILRVLPNLHGFEIIRLIPKLSRYMDRSQAGLLASRADVIVELPIPHYVSTRRGLHQLYVTLRKMYAYDVPFTISSDSKKVDKLWTPQMKVGLLEALGVPGSLASLPVYSYPYRLLVIRDIYST